MSIIPCFSAPEVLDHINDGFAGQDCVGLWTMAMLKKPDSENVKSIFVQCLEFLGCEVRPVLPAHMLGMEHPSILKDDHLFSASIVSNMRKTFRQYGIHLTNNFGGEFCHGDFLVPRSKRFLLILTQLLSIGRHIVECDERMRVIDEKYQEEQKVQEKRLQECEDLARQVEEKQREEENVETRIKQLEIAIKEKQTSTQQKAAEWRQLAERKEAEEKKSHVLEQHVNNLANERKMLSEEQERLKELVVSDPDEWEKTFVRIREKIEENRAAINDLRRSIPGKKDLDKNLLKNMNSLEMLFENVQDLARCAKDFEEHKENFRQIENEKQTKVEPEKRRIEDEMKVFENDIKLKIETMAKNTDRTLREAVKIRSDLEKQTDKNNQLEQEFEQKAANHVELQQQTSELDDKRHDLQMRHDTFIEEISKVVLDHVQVQCPEIMGNLIGLMKTPK